MLSPMYIAYMMQANTLSSTLRLLSQSFLKKQNSLIPLRTFTTVIALQDKTTLIQIESTDFPIFILNQLKALKIILKR